MELATLVYYAKMFEIDLNQIAPFLRKMDNDVRDITYDDAIALRMHIRELEALIKMFMNDVEARKPKKQKWYNKLGL